MTAQGFKSTDKVWVSRSPSLNKAKQFIEAALQQKRLIQILGHCNVEYYGRARSILTEGERLIILKRDGAILVHKEKGVEPINWQPPGASLKAAIVEGNLCLSATRSKPRETVRIFFSDLLLISASILEDSGEFSMYLTEKEMQQVLSINPELIEPGLRTIRRERKVQPGFIDIFARDKEGHLVVVEIKRRRADSEAVQQLHSYIKSFQKSQDIKTPIRGILVAPALTKGTNALLKQLSLEYRKIEPQQCYHYLQHPTSRRLTEYTNNNE